LDGRWDGKLKKGKNRGFSKEAIEEMIVCVDADGTDVTNLLIRNDLFSRNAGRDSARTPREQGGEAGTPRKEGKHRGKGGVERRG